MSFKIKGIAKYVDLGTGFWGIVAKDGKEYLPVNMPEQLKSDNHKVECRAVKYDGVSMHMWGEMVKIVSFKTITP